MGGDRRAVIGASAKVRGRVHGDGDLVVEGAIEGDVAIRGDLTVESGARLASNVEAHAVTIGGVVEGDVSARGVVHVRAGATLRGDVRGESLAIDEGAEFAGRVEAEFDLPPELGGSGAPARGASARRR
jgi:cytoskeletal protein CcmA (bactofilin family)